MSQEKIPLVGGENYKISVVIPVYQAQGCLEELYNRLTKVLSGLTGNFEIILVNDGSPDNSWEIIKSLAAKDKRVRGINFSRNFGQHYAITAGLEEAAGDWIVVMDCDLQDQPEEIEKFYKKTIEGYDVILGRRVGRQDGLFKKIFSKLFYAVLGYLTGIKQDSSVANFGIYHRKVVRAVISMGDNIRFFPPMVKWAGFRRTSIDVVHAARISGKTSYNFRKAVNLALDVMVSFSDRPLKLAVKTGFAISFLSFIAGIIILIEHFRGEILIAGWASLIISVWFLSGLIIFVLGVVGLYVGKIFEKVKERPLYIISDKAN